MAPLPQTERYQKLRRVGLRVGLGVGLNEKRQEGVCGARCDDKCGRGDLSEICDGWSVRQHRCGKVKAELFA